MSAVQSIATFGAGGSEPYASALIRGDVLYLQNMARGSDRVVMDVSKWSKDADHADLTLLSSVTGPMLDIGCGPGRMVRAAMALGLVALGVDVSEAAIGVARGLGGSYLRASVFDYVPGQGSWQTALLVDGNIGIGGDIPNLLARTRDLLAASGEIVIELHSDPDHVDHYVGQVLDGKGRGSDSFPWAEIGRDQLVHLLPQLQLTLVQSWELGGRSFCRLAKIAR